MTITRPRPGAVLHPDDVDAALREFLAARRADAESISPAYAAAVAELERYVLRGGKRVRPAFAWLGWIGAGGDETGPEAEAVLRTCAALELFHAYGLIHDDVIDASLTRRGAPAAHVMFADQHRARCWSGSAELFGTGAAILIGDLAQCWADDMIRTSGLSARAQRRVDPVWTDLRTEVLCGQLLDLTAEAAGDEDIGTALRVNQYKTASYTVERPLHIGAAIAGAGAELVAAYRAFGVDIGVAFQLRDDLLGVFGAPEETGKPSGDDLVQGKRTVLFTSALRYADERDPDAAKFLRARIGTRISEDELRTMRAIITEVGAVDRVERDIAARTERALAVLRASGATEGAKERLTAMAISATQRTS
ncbi:polyprenyl synthetase family protein [Streptomyces qinzhouensis]|uniref:Polyprenyl synthetase family protein n=1 Tax=Streptomyces qinzhouensis TaxID=2599401 RepID=A0A5B8JRI9_9ACTN|nr:polyprenyl synthetase family protein [Streptomyces qinzhouensis]QDY75188.1 polyprenyl synthetase family protein [Streptomyces qinzhouensis]QDY80610.1 polyprenyl synthetase family protein [Streptomyces qinzhouensis]